MTRNSLDARSLCGPSYSTSPPSSFLFYGHAVTSSWLPNKVPVTRTTKACSFSIEAILSVDSRESPAQAKQVQQPAARHPASMATWAHLGHSTTNSLYPLYFGHLQPRAYKQVLHKGQSCSLLRGNFVRRRIRTIFTDAQLTKLEAVFSKQQYMTGAEKMLLASTLRLTETQVKVWFQNRRTRWRKSHGDTAASAPDSNESNLDTPVSEDEFISVDNDDSSSWVNF